jgi:uncharacterized protein YndB with AHSA1/START domain
MTLSADKPERHAAVSFEYELDAPPALVWRALTIPEFVARWLAPGVVEQDAEAPAQQDAASLPVSFHLLDEEPCQSVRYLWRDGASPFAESLVTFHLHANDSGGTTFRIVHELKPAARILPRQSPANRNASPLLLAA